ncbi:amidohydrolase family protein [Vibrio penaeicida]|uniref:amidohydrolase family protein n=1 Tax=Vibrio penaeicida TaxID=104609 RepID=UPI00142D648D|nr:amidohydrolase family protein [Vibrio penaeicida]
MRLPIDTHTHAWDDSCSLMEQRRYTPSMAHTCPMLLEEMASCGVGRAVLVQPSFLGSDNTYLLNQLAANRSNLRGVAVVEANIASDVFEQMVKQGIVGIRLNLIGSCLQARDVMTRYERLFDLLKQHHCHVEIQALGEYWASLLPKLLEKDIDIVVDHFGRPESENCVGFKSIVDNLNTGQVWVKLSGSYRFNADAKKLTRALLRAQPQRLVWGSDYPWTQHSEGKSYQGCLDLLKEWTEGNYLDDILTNNPAKLFKFE